MTVVCFKCHKECSDYEFKVIGTDIRPLCTECSGRKKVMESLVALQEERLERAWNGKDLSLMRWIK